MEKCPDVTGMHMPCFSGKAKPVDTGFHCPFLLDVHQGGVLVWARLFGGWDSIIADCVSSLSPRDCLSTLN
ncbi:hypothetical protein CEXT_793411 [Caerostris extrusa]|uniref:Uncharacterized protein n=1 Tax=Caerostris extrusa TaxID=172846 RepID=A0AAV4SUM7_CAEEX|nr:hypothetical protein CEXT_793411 [Caerostris extrusa]